MQKQAERCCRLQSVLGIFGLKCSTLDMCILAWTLCLASKRTGGPHKNTPADVYRNEWREKRRFSFWCRERTSGSSTAVCSESGTRINRTCPRWGTPKTQVEQRRTECTPEPRSEQGQPGPRTWGAIGRIFFKGNGRLQLGGVHCLCFGGPLVKS